VFVCEQLWQSVPVITRDLGRPAGWTVEWNHINCITGLSQLLLLITHLIWHNLHRNQFVSLLDVCMYNYAPMNSCYWCCGFSVNLLHAYHSCQIEKSKQSAW